MKQRDKIKRLQRKRYNQLKEFSRTILRPIANAMADRYFDRLDRLGMFI